MKTAKNEALMALKLAHRKSREEEIALFGHPINYRKVFTDKTKYNRARDKANRHKGGSPYFFLLYARFCILSAACLPETEKLVTFVSLKI